jgi:cell division protein FtsB
VRRLRIVSALLAVSLVYLAVDRRSGISTWMHQRADLENSDEQIAELEAENARLEQEIESLQRDAFAIERAIREDLEYARIGETVIRVPDESDSNPRIP